MIIIKKMKKNNLNNVLCFITSSDSEWSLVFNNFSKTQFKLTILMKNEKLRKKKRKAI